jgi:hypothetical protein
MKKFLAVLVALGLSSFAFASDANKTEAKAEKKVEKKAEKKAEHNKTKKAKKEANATK